MIQGTSEDIPGNRCLLPRKFLDTQSKAFDSNECPCDAPSNSHYGNSDNPDAVRALQTQVRRRILRTFMRRGRIDAQTR